MKQELQQQLFDKYPKIFVQKDLPMSETCMCWGIDIGIGWYDLIDILCACIQNEVKYNDSPDVQAVQVKEKFGGLRFYIQGGNDRVEGMISMAESMSYHICDECGNPGRPNKSGWIRTRCKEHEIN